MNEYAFVIGSMDDYDSLEELRAAADPDAVPPPFVSIFRFQVPDGLDEETITMIGRGYAFSNGWGEDHTFSFVMEC